MSFSSGETAGVGLCERSVDPLLDLLEAALGRAHAARHVGEPEHLRIEVERLPVRLGRPREVFLFLRDARERSRRPRQRVGARAIPVGELRRLAIASRVAEPLRLLQRVGAAIDVFQAVDERSHEPEKRIGPVRTQLGGFAKGGDGIREFVLRLGGLLVRLARFAVDPVQVAVAVAQRALELTVVRVRGHRARQRLARQSSTAFP